MAVDVDQWEMDRATDVAGYTARKWRLDIDDVQAHLWAWLCEPSTQKYVLRYRGEGGQGRAKLTTAMQREAGEYAAKETRATTPVVPVGQFAYTLDALRALLPYAWRPEDWPQTQGAAERFAGSGSESTSAVAMLADVSGAVREMSKGDQALLMMRYHHGNSHGQMAERLGTQAETARKRVGRALRRLQARLGGCSLSWSVGPVTARP